MDLELTTCSRDEVLRHVENAQRSGRPFDAVISLEDPDAESRRRSPRLLEILGDDWKGQQLILQCFDTDYPRPGEPAPSAKIVREALNFVKKQIPQTDKLRLLVNCYGGFSRSTALGYILLCHARGPGLERECLHEVLDLNPEAKPNKAIVAHGDKLLGRNGRMMIIFEHPQIRENRNPLLFLGR